MKVIGVPPGVQPSVALSQATMSAASLAGAVKSLFDSHPENADKPVVDYSLGLILSPGMLMGSSIGDGLASDASPCIIFTLVLAHQSAEAAWTVT